MAAANVMWAAGPRGGGVGVGIGFFVLDGGRILYILSWIWEIVVQVKVVGHVVPFIG